MEKHIEPTRFNKTLSPEELNHLSSCRFCREELAEHVVQHELIKAPKNMKASILERSKRPDIQFIAGTNQISKRLQLFYFSLKVGAAILCVLTMLIAAPDFTNQIKMRESKAEAATGLRNDNQFDYYEKVKDFTAQLNKLSNRNREVINHDKEKK